MIYKSDRYFQTWAYGVSHSLLLLRSPMMFPEQEEYSEATSYNIDIEFLGVYYFDLPDQMTGVQIRRLVNNIPEKFKRLGLTDKVFEIKSGENSFYLVAGGYRVAKSYWIGENRIFNPSLKYDEIIFNSYEDEELE